MPNGIFIELIFAIIRYGNRVERTKYRIKKNQQQQQQQRQSEK